MSDQSVVPGKPSLAARIDEEKSKPLAWKTVAKRAAMVVIAGVAIFYMIIRHHGGSGARAEGHTVVDKPPAEQKQGSWNYYK